ncbi:MAG: hypothetical protein H6Q30_3101 [Bacteroidetes bacterium]|jgi:hypothetical protein|nr:hypothetical protein [Bacteroidota bacterium]
MEKHLRLLPILYIVFGSLHFFGGLIAWGFVRWAGLTHDFSSADMVGRYLFFRGIVAMFLIGSMLLWVAGIIGAIGLLKRKRWARIVLLAVSFLTLIHFPFGTALGAYGIWVLMKDETDASFAPAGMSPKGTTSGL